MPSELLALLPVVIQGFGYPGALLSPEVPPWTPPPHGWQSGGGRGQDTLVGLDGPRAGGGGCTLAPACGQHCLCGPPAAKGLGMWSLFCSFRGRGNGLGNTVLLLGSDGVVSSERCAGEPAGGRVLPGSPTPSWAGFGVLGRPGSLSLLVPGDQHPLSGSAATQRQTLFLLFPFLLRIYF